MVSLTLLFFCRDISGYLCNYDREQWFYYFTIVERLSMLLLLVSVLKQARELNWLVAELLLFWLSQDLIDRVFINIRSTTITDFLITTILIGIFSIKHVQKTKQ